MTKKDVSYIVIGLFILMAYVYFWRKRNPEPQVFVAPSTPPKTPEVPMPTYTDNSLHKLYKSPAFN